MNFLNIQEVVFSNEQAESQKIVEIGVFFLFLLVDVRIGIHSNNDGSESGFGRPKNIRILRIRLLIHNTVLYVYVARQLSS
jgi:hypothetical protein